MKATYTDEELLAIIQSVTVPEEKELLAGTAISPEKATGLLIERHQPRLVKLATRYWKGDEAAAWDTLQETLIKAVLKIQTVQGDFGAWINKVLLNQCRDQWRKNRGLTEKCTILSLDTLDVWKKEGENKGANKAERLLNKQRASVSAEDAYMDEAAEERVIGLIRTSLSKRDADFFLEYQAGPAPKKRKDKTRYHRLKNTLLNDLIQRWVRSGRSLEEAMPARQAKALRAKYSLGHREADIFKEQGLSDKAELNQLLADGTVRLFNACCAEGLDI